MKLGESAKLFAANFAWRLTGAKFAGRTLIKGVSSADENTRLISGMFLVKGGSRAKELFREALNAGAVTPLLLRVIGDSGLREFEPELKKYQSSEDPKLAKAASSALAVLQQSNHRSS